MEFAQSSHGVKTDDLATVVGSSDVGVMRRSLLKGIGVGTTLILRSSCYHWLLILNFVEAVLLIAFYVLFVINCLYVSSIS